MYGAIIWHSGGQSRSMAVLLQIWRRRQRKSMFFRAFPPLEAKAETTAVPQQKTAVTALAAAAAVGQPLRLQ